MKISEFKKLIREEVRAVVKEVHSIKPYSKDSVIYKLKSDTSSMYLVIYTSNDDDYFGFDKLPFNKLPFNKVAKTTQDNFVILYKLDNASKDVIKALGNRLPEVQSPQQVGTYQEDKEFVLANPLDLVPVSESELKENNKMKKSELVKMIREEVASLLREKSMKRKNIKEVGEVGEEDPAIVAADNNARKAKEEFLKRDTLAKDLKAKAAKEAQAAQAAKR